MSKENLLVRIAETVGSRQAENVASAALTYLLQRDAGVRHAFVSLVERIAEVTFADGMSFRGQVGAEGLGVTDISGVIDGAEVLIIEAKILAGLGPDQASTYVRRLNNRGVLAILAPAARLVVVFDEACRQSGVDSAEALRAARDDLVIVGLTWERVLDSVEASAHDPGARAEVEQVAGLYRRLESRAFMPFASDDISIRTARLWLSMDTIVTRVKAQLSTSRPPDDAAVIFPTRWPTRGGECFYGAWCTVAGFNAWFGRHTDHWAAREEAPYWLQLNQLDQGCSDRISAALAHEAEERGLRIHRDAASTDVFVPLRPPVGVDADEVVSALVARLREIASRLATTGLQGPFAPGIVVPDVEDTPNDV